MQSIVPAGDWRDTKGNLIAATEGGIIKVDDLYYLWGMDRSKSNYAFVGINLYSSPDLKNWTFVNQILKRTSHLDLNNDAVVERAKLLHNKRTGQFVIWMHYEGHNAYSVAEVAYATCATIGGNYTFQSHFRPLNIDSRDLNVYQDDDGKAYLICTTKGNQNVSLFELDDNYTGIVKEVYRGAASNDMECEGHAIIKTGGYYFWLMSWCTGWDFNDNRYFYSKSLAGPWTSGGNVAVTNTHTYESQVGFAVPVVGSATTTFLYLADRWSVNNFAMSRIVLLPMVVTGTKLSVPWNDQWNIDTKTGVWAPGAPNFVKGVYKITAKHSGKVLGTNGSAIQQQTYTGADNQLWRIQNLGASFFRITSVESGKVIDISGASRTAGAKALQYTWSDAYNQKWQIHDDGKGYHRLVNVNTLGKALQIMGKSTANGTDAEIGDFNYSDHQLWQITAVQPQLISGNSYKIVNRTSGKVVDGGNGLETTPIVQMTSAAHNNQLWKVKDLNNGYYTFTNVASGKLLDNGESVANLGAVFQKAENQLFGQQWQAIELDNGYFKLMNRMSGKLLDNTDGLATDGNPLIQYSDYAATNNNQQWSFLPATIVTDLAHEGDGVNIVVLPNPATEKLTVRFGTQRIEKLDLRDMQGSLVWQYQGALANEWNIPTQHLSNGVYTLSMEGPQGRSVHRVVVKK